MVQIQTSGGELAPTAVPVVFTELLREPGLGWNVLAAAHTNIIPPDTSGKAATGIISIGTNKRQKHEIFSFISEPI